MVLGWHMLQPNGEAQIYDNRRCNRWKMLERFLYKIHNFMAKAEL